MTDLPSFRLQPDPDDVSELAHAAVEFRYLLILNYLNADLDGNDDTPRPIVRKMFHRLLTVTTEINKGRSEELKTDAHITAARELADRFESEWMNVGHRERLDLLHKRRDFEGELTPKDWTDIHREAEGIQSDEARALSSLRLDAQVLNESPFCDASWEHYEAKLNAYVCTFDPPCRKVYEIVRVLAGVCYPNPSSYDETLNTLPNFDDEHLIKQVNGQVRELMAEFQSLTGLKLKTNQTFNPQNPYGSAVRLFKDIKRIFRGLSGSDVISPDRYRPRWKAEEPGGKIAGRLTFRGVVGTVTSRGKLIVPILEAFEAVSWLSPIPDPKGSRRSVRKSSLKRWAEDNRLPICFYAEGDGGQIVWQWRPIDELSEPST